MYKSWLRALATVVLALCTSISTAQQQTDNLIYSTTNAAPQGAAYNWSGFVNTTSNGGGISGGSSPGYNVSTGTFMMGYNQSTIAYSLALSSALANSGMKIGGISYGFQYYNQDWSRGTLSTTVNLLSNNGSVLQSYFHSLPQTTNGWTNFDQTKTFNDQYSLASLGNVSMSWTGKDDRWWAGYYGPQFKNQYLRLNYASDPCSVDPLSSTSCPGYAQAYFTQQCTANPLYNSACPGYAQAYYTQQCTANPLYDSGCPGYAQAYYTQQCTANPLYDKGCTGYAQAYYTQQCTANPLYDKGCTGYAQAYYTQQCTANPLYDKGCTGYAQAYYTQQCTANPLYDSGCPGYAQAYFNQQCTLNGLYDRTCPNYATAYATKQLTTPTTTTTTITTSVTTDPVVAVTNPVSVATTQPSTTSTTSPTSVTSVTSVIAPAPSPTANTNTPAPAPAPVASSDQQKQDTKKTDATVASIEKKAENKSDARAAATERAKQIARQASGATSMESQMETQGQLLGLMGYVPGFTAYQNATLRDINEREMMKKYGKDTVDNRSLLRRLGGASEARWREMVDSQYQMPQ
jgi:hypothetical protein